MSYREITDIQNAILSLHPNNIQIELAISDSHAYHNFCEIPGGLGVAGGGGLSCDFAELMICNFRKLCYP